MNDTWDSADIDAAIADLRAALWVPMTPTIWKSPEGKLYQGPAGAWKAMKYQQNDARQSTQSWAVSVARNGEEIVTLQSNGHSGRDISDEDARIIKLAAKHLLAFVGAADQESTP